MVHAALYARVSSDRQAEAGTIESQVADLRARAAADGAGGARGAPVHRRRRQRHDAGAAGVGTLARPRGRRRARPALRARARPPRAPVRLPGAARRGAHGRRRGGRVPEPAAGHDPRGRAAVAGAGDHGGVRAGHVPGALAPGQAARRPGGLGERAPQGALRLPLRRPPGRRRALLRARGRAGPGGAPDLRLGGPRAPDARPGRPAPRGGGHPDGHRQAHLGPVRGLDAAPEPDLRRPGPVRDAPGRPLAPAAAAAPRAGRGAPRTRPRRSRGRRPSGSASRCPPSSTRPPSPPCRSGWRRTGGAPASAWTPAGPATCSPAWSCAAAAATATTGSAPSRPAGGPAASTGTTAAAGATPAATARRRAARTGRCTPRSWRRPSGARCAACWSIRTGSRRSTGAA